MTITPISTVRAAVERALRQQQQQQQRTDHGNAVCPPVAADIIRAIGASA